MDEGLRFIGIFIKMLLLSAAIFLAILLADLVARKLWSVSFRSDLLFLSVLIPLLRYGPQFGDFTRKKPPGS